MKPFTVFLSESGGAAAICAIKSFRDFKPKDDGSIRIITADADAYAAGRDLSDSFHVCPRASDNTVDYLKWLNDLIKEEQIDLILPTGEHDLRLLSLYKNTWENTKIYVSSEKSINICQNKALFYKELKNNFPLPLTIEGDLFQKPKRSAGSRGIKMIANDNNNIIQEYLPGKEYTVDVFCDENSKSMGTVVRERVVIKSGISTQNKVCNFEKRDLIQMSEEICNFLKLIGPVCIQFKQDSNGIEKLIEVNPRLGGSSIVSTLAGVNFAELYYRLYHGEPTRYNSPKNIHVSRYWEEVVYENIR